MHSQTILLALLSATATALPHPQGGVEPLTSDDKRPGTIGDGPKLKRDAQGQTFQNVPPVGRFPFTGSEDQGLERRDAQGQTFQNIPQLGNRLPFTGDDQQLGRRDAQGNGFEKGPPLGNGRTFLSDNEDTGTSGGGFKQRLDA